ncbi:serine acetyltransferase [Flavobacteriaceae bacterium]|jgi:serine O-acetyltransferase|nr:serine acetyltransferase [Flavobacteriaceae bacterium]
MFKKDLLRYKDKNGNIDWSEPSILIILIYRLGKSIEQIKYSPLRRLLFFIHLPFYAFFTLLTGIHIPRSCEIGHGLRIYHFGCVILNPLTKIGLNCTLRHGVTIGNRRTDNDVPILGNNVNVGAGAKILGKITIGNNVDIGANAVVLIDVPDNHIAVGIPAHLRKK